MPKHLFLGSLYQSGGKLLYRLLAEHPEITGLKMEQHQELTEGQLLQTIYEPTEFWGGPGIWGFQENAHLTALSNLAKQASNGQLLKQWTPYWDKKKTIKLEYSTANVLKSRFLNHLFPNSYQVFILRHPISYAYAVEAAFADSDFDIHDLIKHWLYVHQQLLIDCQHLSNVRIIYFEDLLDNPQAVLNTIYQDLKLAPHPIEEHLLTQEKKAKLIGNNWNGSSLSLKNEIKQFLPLFQKFNYAIESDKPLAKKQSFINFAGVDNTQRTSLMPSFLKDKKAPKKNKPSNKQAKNLLFITFGTRGDIQPCIALGLAFQQAGYNIWICSTDEHQSLVENYNLTFVSVGVNHAALNRAISQRKATKISGEHIYQFYQDIAPILTTIYNTCQTKAIDAVLSKLGFLELNLISEYFKLPHIQLNFAPLTIDQEAEDPIIASINGYLGYYTYLQAILSQYKIYQQVNQVYKKLAIPLEAEKSLTLDQLKNVLLIQGYTELFPSQKIPGVLAQQVGPILLKTSKQTQLDHKLEQYLTEGTAPICLNFGSMDPYTKRNWMVPLLAAIRQSGERCISIGKFVPEEVKNWTYWIDFAPHSLLFENVKFVIHHGGTGTTTQCLISGVPSLIIPVMEWADQAKWAAWLQAEKAGIFPQLTQEVTTTLQEEFSQALKTLTNPIYRANAKRLGKLIAQENGIKKTILLVEEFLNRPNKVQKSGIQALKNIETLPIAPKRKLKLALFASLYDKERIPLEILNYRNYTFDFLLKTLKEFPIYQADWPAIHQPLDLQTQDLPHPKASTEIWSFYATVQSKAKTFALTGAFFNKYISNQPLIHTQVTLMDKQEGHFYKRLTGDARGPEILRPYMQTTQNSDYLQRAFTEILEKDEYPLPDKKSQVAPKIAASAMDYQLADFLIQKKKDNSYQVVAKFDGEFGYDLNFKPQNKARLNGVIPDLQLFAYALTNMDVKGSIQTKQQVYQVEGKGWYDHKFGAPPMTKKFTIPTQEWTWMIIQLTNGAEIIYNFSLENSTIKAPKIFYRTPSGEKVLVDGLLTCTKYWTGLETYIKYEVAWTLTIKAINLSLSLKATIPNQEVISIFAQPALWKGSIEAVGTLEDKVISGNGFVEQVGKGSAYFKYKNFLKSVSKQALKAVDNCYPLNPSNEDIERLIGDEKLPNLVQGLSKAPILTELIEPVRMLTDRGGKAWRSMSMMVCIAALGKDPNQFKEFLAFPELIHTGSLIIDDVQDHSVMRRGGATCHEIYGIPTAINAGTAAYFAPETLLRNANLPPSVILEMYQLYFLVLRGGHAGQALDIKGLQYLVPTALAVGEFDKLWEALLVTHRLKSGLAANISARMGVILAEGTTLQKNVLGDYFLAIGVAFQIMDDVINLSGFAKGLKTKGEDLIEGKITAPVIQGLMKLGQKERTKLWEQLEHGAHTENVPSMIALLEDCGALNCCIKYAKELIESAWAKVDELLPESYAKMQLRIFGQFVVEIRDY